MKERNFDIETKISSLLRLSESTASGTDNESKLALEMAIRLASKHGIKLSDLAEKRNEYITQTWFKGGTTTTSTQEYQEEELETVRGWCAYAEKMGWSRYRKSHDDREGWIYAYRKEEMVPKLELRIFNRPWGDVEFEVITNPDPILGDYQSWMDHIFDVIAIGVTFSDFRTWIGAHRPAQLNTTA